MLKKFKKILLFIIYLIIISLSYVFFVFPNKANPDLDFSKPKTISINDNGLDFKAITKAETVNSFLQENKIQFSELDQIMPDKNTLLYSGTQIKVDRAVKINIKVDGEKIENYTLAKNIPKVLVENNITLGRLDKITPSKNSLVENNMEIIITRINVEEKIIPEEIDFKTETKLDSKSGWREKIIQTKGEKGIHEVKYKITYKDGKEISRVALEKNITKDPVTEIITQGTFVKTGNTKTGQGTWYSYQGGLFAASTTIPRGSYAKITNLANGKSVIVQINDYGPQGKDRIIDLDKVAFAKIASLGAGVIGVKVEEILN
ncbi:MAG TPA: hypothetical protein DCS28_03825 [Candidatus Moranbacteria bacterium]|nr:hypothetical protein [Candidatus Moranbacteria bacterium]HAT75140.1 hypothetical protein [Candidatus Moranbacteria bacterium]